MGLYDAMGLRTAKLRRDDRALTSVAYCCALAAIGLVLSEMGPALLELAVQTKSTLTYTGYCFILRSFGYLIGSFVGPLYDRVPGHLILGTGIFSAGVAAAAVPWCKTVAALATTAFFQGFGMGTMDTGCNLLLLYMYSGESATMGPWLQLMHFAFALGAFLGPLLLAVSEATSPRLADHSGLAAQHSYDAAFYVTAVICMFVAAFVWAMKSPRKRGDEGGEQHGGVEVAAAASVTNGSAAGEPLPLALQTPQAGADGSGAAVGASGATAALAAVEQPSQSLLDVHVPREIWVNVVLVSALLFVYVGVETGFGGFITSYGVIALGMTESEGQLLASAYWAAIMVGRLAAVWVSSRLKPAAYLGGLMAGCVAASILLLIGQSHVGVVWIGAVLFGAAMSAVFPTALAFAESCFPVRGSHATAFIVGSATGEMLLPAIIATLIGAGPDEGLPEGAASPPAIPGVPPIGPSIVLWVAFGGCALNMGIYFLVIARGTWLKRAIDAQAAVAAAGAKGHAALGGQAASAASAEVAVVVAAPAAAAEAEAAKADFEDDNAAFR